MCYDDNGRRYPVRLRRQPAEVYSGHLASGKKWPPKKPSWAQSLDSPLKHRPDSCFDSRGRHSRRKFFFSKRSESDESDDDDAAERAEETRFELRHQRGGVRACLGLGGPVNLRGLEGASRGLGRPGVEPLTVDPSVTFEAVGGHLHVIQALKESVVLPLLYPDVFKKLAIRPPRGLLFYGVPGSGKTLMARALVNEVANSSGGACKVSFFMRKGADCLSKWVGESERHLRLLFEEARRLRPSIIFFDEIDGLAPVRSARQDQIHASVVSTLLGLMDGLEDRGDVVVVGATNRLEAVDPALRRPGRFDRELEFPLPGEADRLAVLGIHTGQWRPRPDLGVLGRLAAATRGFSGADLAGLAVEAGLCALRRRYPQIYRASKKLQLDLDQIYVKEEDFQTALRQVRPSGERTGPPLQRRIPERLLPLVKAQYSLLRMRVSALFQEAVFPEDGPPPAPSSASPGRLFPLRLVVTGYEVDLLLAGLLHDLQGVHVSSLDCLSLGTATGLSPEEKLSHIFLEAYKHPRAIVYLPHLDVLFQGLPVTAQHLLLTSVRSAAAHPDLRASRLLVLVSMDSGRPWPELEMDQGPSGRVWSQLGLLMEGTVLEVPPPSLDQARAFFGQLEALVVAPVAEETEGDLGGPEDVLPEARVVNKAPTPEEMHRIEIEEDIVLRKFRIVLRKILTTLAKEKRFQIFHSPVDEAEVPDYYSIITKPMDLSTMRQKVDLYNYCTFEELKSDLHLISANALLYNPQRNSYLKDIRRHAYEFHDIAESVYEDHFSPDFSKTVSSIHEARLHRNYYEKKRERLAAQPGEALDFLADLNGSKYEMSTGPLLDSQLEIFRRMYDGGGDGRQGDGDAIKDQEGPGEARAHSEGEGDGPSVASWPERRRCQSEGGEGGPPSQEPIRSLPVPQGPIRSSPVPPANRGRPPIVDVAACRAVLEEAAAVIKGDCLPLAEAVFEALKAAADRYRTEEDRGGLPLALEVALAPHRP